MILAMKTLVIAAFFVGIGGSQQCSELFCPGNGCLTRDNVCDSINECPDGRGSYFDETNCSSKIYIHMHASSKISSSVTNYKDLRYIHAT